jgi:hypothetical protein
MNRIWTITILVFMPVTACTHRVSTATVEVIDTSASITPRAEKAALDAVHEQIGRMERGDRLVLIPITGNAENDAGGRILRLQAPTAREAYDADLHRFQDAARKQFEAWEAMLGAERCRTDILGSIDAARQEFAALPRASNRTLVIVSDFLEDDGQYRFASDRALATPEPARALAAHLRAERQFARNGIPICLGRLESSDFTSLAPRRKEAVQAFWAAYLSDHDKTPEILLDGTEILAGVGRECSRGTP